MPVLPLKKANLLYVCAMFLVASLGSLLQWFSPFIGLIFTEILFIFGPAWLLLRRDNIRSPFRNLLNKTRSSVYLVSVLLGFGAFLVGSLIDLLMIRLSGYLLPATALIPKNWFQVILIFAGFVVAAPLCEEFLFRGIIQNSYQHHFRTPVAILLSGLLFVLFHMRLQGFAGLVPAALILGFIYWRTKSLQAAIFAHAANNLLSSISLTAAGLFPQVQLSFFTLNAAMMGVMLVSVGILLLLRLTSRPNHPSQEKLSPSLKRSSAWPLLPAVALFALMAVLEVNSQVSPNPVQLTSDNFPAATQLTYELRNKANQLVGSQVCVLNSAPAEIRMNCQRVNQAFEIQIGNSFYSSGAGSMDLDVSWKKEDLSLTGLVLSNRSETYESGWTIAPQDGQLIITLTNQAETSAQLAFDPGVLSAEEWPFRLMGLPFDSEQAWRTSYLVPATWREKTQDSGPVLRNDIVLHSQPESLQVPAGNFETWKVQLSNGQSAWYSQELPHIPVKIDGDIFIYTLMQQN